MHRARSVAALIAVLGVAAPIAVAATGSPRPSVTLAKLPSTVTPGQKLSITGKARAGSHKTGAARMTFALSRDAKLSAKDLRIGSLKIKPIAAHKTRKLNAKLAVPASAATGSYRFLACVKHTCKSVRSVTVQRGNGVFPDSIPKSLPGITPHPRSVTPHLDSAHTVTGAVTPESGGTLSTTGADGTKYTLTVPAGAVLSELTVTMTPLSSVGGLGMSGGFVGGVQMTPDGLQLLKPAKLTIVPTGGAPTSGRTAFAYQGNGTNFGLVPRDPGGALSFELTHFSGVGVGSATSGDLAAQQDHPPVGTPDQFRQEEAERLGTARLQIFNQYYTKILKPQLEAALSDDSLAPAAITQAYGAVLQMEGLGFNIAAEHAEIDRLVIRILKNGFNRAYDRCVKNHDPSEAVNVVGYLRMLRVRGAEGEVDSSKTWKCARFKLDYQVDFTHHGGRDETMGVESLGTQLEYDSSQDAVTGDLPLTVTHYTFHHSLCGSIDGGTTHVTHAGFAKVIVNLIILQALKEKHVVITFGAPITLVLDHGTIEVTHNCANPPDHDPGFYGGEWHFDFADLEQGGANGPSVLGPSAWTYIGAAVWAKTNLAVSNVMTGFDTRTGDLRFTLHHTPVG